MTSLSKLKQQCCTLPLRAPKHKKLKKAQNKLKLTKIIIIKNRMHFLLLCCIKLHQIHFDATCCAGHYAKIETPTKSQNKIHFNVPKKGYKF